MGEGPADLLDDAVKRWQHAMQMHHQQVGLMCVTRVQYWHDSGSHGKPLSQFVSGRSMQWIGKSCSDTSSHHHAMSCAKLCKLAAMAHNTCQASCIVLAGQQHSYANIFRG